MQPKIQLQIHIFTIHVVNVAEVFTQHQRKYQIRKKNSCTDPKDAQEVWKVESSSQNSVTIEDNLTIPCMKYI